MFKNFCLSIYDLFLLFCFVIMSLTFLFCFLLLFWHVFIISKCFVCFPYAPHLSLLPPHFPSFSSSMLSFQPFMSVASCDFVMWLLHGADDVVFADQQKVNFLCLVRDHYISNNHAQGLCWIRLIEEALKHFQFYSFIHLFHLRAIM